MTHTRNEFHIASHNSLGETLLAKTGRSEAARRGFLNSMFS
jgi:hypothetical protein